MNSNDIRMPELGQGFKKDSQTHVQQHDLAGSLGAVGEMLEGFMSLRAQLISTLTPPVMLIVVAGTAITVPFSSSATVASSCKPDATIPRYLSRVCGSGAKEN